MIHIGVLAPGAVLRRGLAAVLGEHPDFRVLFSTPWWEPELEIPACDVLVLGGAPAELPVEMFDRVFSEAQPPGVLFIGGEEPGAAARMDLEGIPWGLLPEDVSDTVIHAAIFAIHAGLTVMYADLRSDRQADTADPEAGPPGGVATLTGRESEVLELLAHGHSNKQIAIQLSISEHTVKFHVSAIYGKLAAGNRAEAVRIGLQLGLIAL